MVWNPEDPQGNEAAKIRWDIVPYTRGHVLDLGSGPFSPFPHFITMDNHTEYEGIDYEPNILGDCTDLSKLDKNTRFDAVFSSHLLEHLEDPQAVLKEWWGAIKPGGYLVLYLPHKDFHWFYPIYITITESNIFR